MIIQDSCRGCRHNQSLLTGRPVCTSPKIVRRGEEFELLSWASIICGGKSGERVFYQPGSATQNQTATSSPSAIE